ncbi:hypothetical protein [Ornithinibacillus contaminans]|uniref:hypothetical protein n=1 Tax=Ornithinibacillus contaminans TaxID=694055 RepID=UPI00064DD0D5|nr:hypothetical protein [Ornithinibacillus contaminans]
MIKYELRGDEMIKKYFLLSILIVFVLMAGCNSDNVSETNGSIHIGGDYHIGNDLNELESMADLIVIGEYGTLEKKWNMARDRQDPKKESTENYFEGNLYNFKIDETIKGTSESEILVNLAYEEEHKYPNESGDDFKFSVKDPYYVEPESHVKYVLFLKKDEMFGNYYGAIEPFQVKIDKNNRVHLVTNQILNEEIKNNSEVHNGKIHFHTQTELEGKTIEIETEVIAIDNFLDGLNLKQLKNTLINKDK